MTYEPRGKVAALLQAMQADPAREWNSTAAAAVMQCSPGAVPAFIETALKRGLLYRTTNNGRTLLSRTPFTPQSGVRAPLQTTATGWRPPRMDPPRGTSAPLPSRVTATVPAAGSVLAIKAAPGPQAVQQPAAAAAEAPADPSWQLELDAPIDPAPALADASTTRGEVDEAPAEPVTWHVWEDGDLDLYGLLEVEPGVYRMPSEALQRLRKFVAWMPPA